MTKHTKPIPPSSAHFVLAALLVLLNAACASPALRISESANQNSRVSIIVIHHTTANFVDSLSILTEPSSNSVSSHYLIPEPGDATYNLAAIRTYQLVPESQRAWHAGRSFWSGKTGLNDQSIGIELVNQTYCHSAELDPEVPEGRPQRLCFYPDFADSQIALLVELLADIVARHPDIKPTHIIGHADIAPGRKIDPGPRFPWQRLASLGFGAWYDDATVVRYWEQFRTQPLAIDILQAALGVYGYDIEVSGVADDQTQNVVRAFQAHFRPNEVTGQMSPDSTAILFALIEKYYPEQLDELLLAAAENYSVDDSAPPGEPATID